MQLYPVFFEFLLAKRTNEMLALKKLKHNCEKFHWNVYEHVLERQAYTVN